MSHSRPKHLKNFESLQNLDEGSPIEISDEGMLLTQNHRVVSKFEWGPRQNFRGHHNFINFWV